jgi:hypothetical protein
MSYLPAIRRPKISRWPEYLTSAVAIFVSLISLWIGIGTEDANQKMVAAASWPFLQLESENSDDAGKPHIQLSLVNAGVGPAKIESFEVFWKGRAYRTSQNLLHECCHLKYIPFKMDAGEPFQGPQSAPMVGFVIRPSETRPFLGLLLGQENRDAWQAFDRVRMNELRFRACYCSVFDECWGTTLRDLHPVAVKSCPVPKTGYTE